MTSALWDKVGYGLMAMFAVSGFDDPDYFTMLLIFGAVALLFWSIVQERRLRADKASRPR